MNNSTYIFGKLKGGYTQYPADSLKTLFEQCINLARDDKQMIVHRRNDLIFYTYIQYLNNRHSSFIGISLAFSGLIAKELKPMFSLFEEGVKSLAITGEILTFYNDNIIANTSSLADKSAEVRNLDIYLSTRLECIQHIMQPLPPISYSVSNTSIKKCNLYSNIDTLFNNTITYGFTIISPGITDDEPNNEISKALQTKKRNKTSFIDKILLKLNTLCKQ